MYEPKITTKKLRDERGEVFCEVKLREESPGSYPRKLEVLVEGELLGTLTYTEQRYNVRPKPVTVKTWTARRLDGEKLGGDRTQKYALAALFKACGMSTACAAVLR